MSVSKLQNISLKIVAVICVMVAILIVIYAGLPERREFTGFIIDDIGYIAPAIGEIAPPFRADLLTGEEVDLIDLRGEWVIINFWATWCAPCIIEMPELQSLYEANDITIIAVNIAENPQIVTAWVEELALTFDIALDPQQAIYTMYRVRGQPSTFVVNPDGIITDIFLGATTADTLQTIIDAQ